MLSNIGMACVAETSPVEVHRYLECRIVSSSLLENNDSLKWLSCCLDSSRPPVIIRFVGVYITEANRKMEVSQSLYGPQHP
jgi:hypothetical protein